MASAGNIFGYPPLASMEENSWFTSTSALDFMLGGWGAMAGLFAVYFDEITGSTGGGLYQTLATLKVGFPDSWDLDNDFPSLLLRLVIPVWARRPTGDTASLRIDNGTPVVLTNTLTLYSLVRDYRVTDSDFPSGSWDIPIEYALTGAGPVRCSGLREDCWGIWFFMTE